MPSQSIAIQHREAIIEQVATGDYLRDIAARFGTSPARISDKLGKDPEYLQARELALETRLEQREKQLEEAPGVIAEISRASALVRQAQWRCEREAPHRWGQKSEVTHRDGDLGDALRRAQERRGRVIEHESQASPAPVAVQPQIGSDSGG